MQAAILSSFNLKYVLHYFSFLGKYLVFFFYPLDL